MEKKKIWFFTYRFEMFTCCAPVSFPFPFWKWRAAETVNKHSHKHSTKMKCTTIDVYSSSKIQLLLLSVFMSSIFLSFLWASTLIFTWHRQQFCSNHNYCSISLDPNFVVFDSLNVLSAPDFVSRNGCVYIGQSPHMWTTTVTKTEPKSHW